MSILIHFQHFIVLYYKNTISVIDLVSELNIDMTNQALQKMLRIKKKPAGIATSSIKVDHPNLFVKFLVFSLPHDGFPCDPFRLFQDNYHMCS